MKNIAEIYKALLDGETISRGKLRLKLINGGLYGSYSEYDWKEYSESYVNPGEFEIYKEPKWYDDIPEGGVICKVRDNLSNRWLTSVIVDYDTKRILPYVTASGGVYRYAEPLDLTKPLAPQLEPV